MQKTSSDSNISSQLDVSNDEFNNSNQLFKVEKILKERYRKGQLEYFIKWHGYGRKFNSWKPAQNVVIQGSQ